MTRGCPASWYYDLTAGLYDRMMRISSWLDRVDEDAERQRLVSLLQLQPGETVLVVAVGTGRDLPEVASQVGPEARLWGVDLSRPMLKVCRGNLVRLGLEAKLVQADAAHLPFASWAFGAALLFGGLNGFQDRGRALEEIVRATRAGGRVVISDKAPRPDSAPSLRTRWMSRLRREPVLPPPISLIPVPAENIELSWVWGGMFYALTVRKP